jgi:hypothetical protein
MISKNNYRYPSKALIVILTSVTAALVTSSSAGSFVVAQQQLSGSKVGTIASIQNGENGKPSWIVAGAWDFKNINSSSPTFNATFNMVMLNGSAPHKHTITDFKISGSPTKQNKAIIYNGTATVSLKAGPASNVPISIKLMGPQAMSLWIDPGKTGHHFGNTPIYGAQHRIG